MSELARRAVAERPLGKLTDAELDAIEQLGPVLGLLRRPLSEPLEDLRELAGRELAERMMRAEVGS